MARQELFTDQQYTDYAKLPSPNKTRGTPSLGDFQKTAGTGTGGGMSTAVAGLAGQMNDRRSTAVSTANNAAFGGSGSAGAIDRSKEGPVIEPLTSEPAGSPAQPANPSNNGGSTTGSLSQYVTPGSWNTTPYGTPPPIPTGGGVPGADIKAKTGTVEDNMLVANQMNQLLDKNSEYIQQARARARQAANARGMANGSLAAMSGEEAAIAAALPIAQQDANTQFTNQRDNLGYENNFGLADKNNALQYDMQGRDINSRERMNTQNNNASLQVANANRAASVSNAYLQAQIQREQLSQQDRQFNAELSWKGNEANIDRDWRAMMSREGWDREDNRFLSQLSHQDKWNMLNLSQNTMTNFGNQYTQIMSSQMSAADKENAIRNLLSYNAGQPWFPYKPASGAYAPAPAPAPAPPPPPDNGGGGQ